MVQLISIIIHQDGTSYLHLCSPIQQQKIAYITIYIRVSGQWTEQLFAPPGDILDYKWICWHRKTQKVRDFNREHYLLMAFCPPLTNFVDILRVIWLANIIKNKGDNEIIWYKDKLTTIWLILTNNLKSSFPIQYFIQHHFSIPFFTDLTFFAISVLKVYFEWERIPKNGEKTRGAASRTFDLLFLMIINLKRS